MVKVNNTVSVAQANEPAFTGLGTALLSHIKGTKAHASRLEQLVEEGKIQTPKFTKGRISRLFVSKEEAMLQAGREHDEARRLDEFRKQRAAAAKLNQPAANPEPKLTEAQRAREFFSGAEEVAEQTIKSVVQKPKTKQEIAKGLIRDLQQVEAKGLAMQETNPEGAEILMHSSPNELSARAADEARRLTRMSEIDKLKMYVSPNPKATLPSWGEIKQEESRQLRDSARAFRYRGLNETPSVQDAFSYKDITKDADRLFDEHEKAVNAELERKLHAKNDELGVQMPYNEPKKRVREIDPEISRTVDAAFDGILKKPAANETIFSEPQIATASAAAE